MVVKHILRYAGLIRSVKIHRIDLIVSVAVGSKEDPSTSITVRRINVVTSERSRESRLATPVWIHNVYFKSITLVAIRAEDYTTVLCERSSLVTTAGHSKATVI